MVSKIGNGAYRLRTEPEADTHRTGREWLRSKSPRDLDGGHDTRGIVVGLIGMTYVSHDEHFACRSVCSILSMYDCGRYFKSLCRICNKFRFDNGTIFFVTR